MRMRTSLYSFISLALSVPVSKKTTGKRSLSVPRFSEDRAIFLSVPLQNLRVQTVKFCWDRYLFLPEPFRLF